MITFLGVLLNGKRLTLGVLEDKRLKVLNMVSNFSQRKKATVKELQRLAGTLNFLTKAIHPGHPFLRRMYSKFAFDCKGRIENKHIRRINEKLKHYHYVRLDREFKLDCVAWKAFLENIDIICRPLVDYSKNAGAETVPIYSDASANHKLGFAAVFLPFWTFGVWEVGWIRKNKPSITFLELYALLVGIMTWQGKLRNVRLTVFCDNKSVRDMMNSQASGCKNCMKLIRILTLNNLKCNRRVFVKYVKSSDNGMADALSR